MNGTDEPSYPDLAGQTAVVTGASSGIGAAVAEVLGKSGVNVVANFAGNKVGADEVAQRIFESGGTAICVKADVGRESDVVAMFRRAVEAFGTVDILVNNAGVQKDAPLVDMTRAQWDRVIQTNLTGAFLCAREAAREFLRRGMVPERSGALGKIVFVSSVHEVIPWAGHANYAASKGGVMLLMKSIAQELGPKKVRVNSVAPGAIKTPINKAAWDTPEAETDLLRLIPYKRVGEPMDIAKACLWLASDRSDYVHGTSLIVDGGMTLYPSFAAGG